MKEKYFTTANIETKSLEMLEDVIHFRNRHNIDFISGNSALIVLDMQKYFLDESSHAYIPAAKPIITGINYLIHAFKQSGNPVIYTRHLNTEKDADAMSRWWDDLIKVGNGFSSIMDEFETSKCLVIKKTQYDAFFQTDLENILKNLEVRRVVICGVMTHLCCETTARSAFVRGFDVFFTVDGTATYNEKFHRASLLNLSHGCVVPVLIPEIMDKFK